MREDLDDVTNLFRSLPSPLPHVEFGGGLGFGLALLVGGRLVCSGSLGVQIGRFQRYPTRPENQVIQAAKHRRASHRR